MEEGLVQLLFILLIFVAAIFDSIARSRKKRQRMEEMDHEEGGEGFEEEWERSEPEAPVREPEPVEATSTAEPPESRETADRMVPEDFWAILTGQEPPPAPTKPTPTRREEPPPSERSEPMRPAPEWDERRQEVEEALGRRSEPDPPKRPKIPQPVPGDRYSDRAEPDAREVTRRPEPVRRTGEGIAARVEEPWEEIPDISAGEIGEERPRRPRPVRQRRFPGPTARRGRPASRYARLLEAGDRESLREAIVLREVLDVPLGRRGSFGGWEEER